MGEMASQITSLSIVYWSLYSGANKRKHQSSASLAFVRGIHRWPMNSPHKGSVTRKMFPFDDVVMIKMAKAIEYVCLWHRWMHLWGGHTGVSSHNTEGCVPRSEWPRMVTEYRQVSNIRRTLVGNKIVDHSDVVGASPVGAAPTTSSFST